MQSQLFILFYLMCYVNFVSCKRPCYRFNPLAVNTTQSPEVLKCPSKCDCQYCRLILKNVLTYEHKVDCKVKEFKRIPSNDLPTDAESVTFSTNKITVLSADTFKRIPQAFFLDLSSNRLDHTYIDDNAFRGLSKLRTLRLSENRAISRIRRAWLEPLASLEQIYFSSSHVLSIEEGAFIGLKNLCIVTLHNNAITKLPPELFHGFPRLQRIILQHNSISSLPPDMFKNSSDVLEINVAYNQLTSISESVKLQNLKKLERVSVQNNPFTCNCDIRWLRSWLFNVTKVTVLGKDEIVCATGPEEVIKKKVNEFDIDALHCKPQTVLLVAVTCSSCVVISLIASLIYYYRWNIRYWYQKKKLRKQYKRLTESSAPPLDQSIKYDAFISYNSKDQEWITGVLQPTLEGPLHNFSLCIDYRDFLVGEAIAQNIANSIRLSRKTVLVVSKNFVNSEWCNFELEMAHNRMFDEHEDILVTILLEEVKVSSIPVLLQKVLRKRTYIQWPNEEGREVFWMRVARAIGSPNVPLEVSRTNII